MSSRKYLRGIARAKLERQGAGEVNRRMGRGWRKIMNAYPGFRGKKRQKPGSSQPILIYPPVKGGIKALQRSKAARRLAN